MSRDHAGTLVALVEHYAAELDHYRRVARATDRRMVALIEECRHETRMRRAAEAVAAEWEAKAKALEARLASLDEPVAKTG